jgi:hypothetical protein
MPALNVDKSSSTNAQTDCCAARPTLLLILMAPSCRWDVVLAMILLTIAIWLSDQAACGQLEVLSLVAASLP